MLPSFCVLAMSLYATDPEVRAKLLLHSEYYTVTWGAVAKFDPTAELEVTHAEDHMPWNLDWYRFRPGKEGVEVLAVKYSPAPPREKEKAGMDVKEVTVKSARMKADDYKALLRGLAVVDSATLRPAEELPVIVGFHTTWHQVRLTSDGKTPLNLNRLGGWEVQYLWQIAKPETAVSLVWRATQPLDFKKHKLTADDRAWVVAKFHRDWKALKNDKKDEKSMEWVRERALTILGEVDGEVALPVLRHILKDEEGDWIDAMEVATRVLKKDVRKSTLGVLDVEQSRKNVLELLKDVK